MDENVPARATRQEVGAFGEGVAARYLADRGLEIIDRNWRCRLGEIDLVARAGFELVFCEVKTRSSLVAGDPLEAVTQRKVARLHGLAHEWARQHPDVRHRRLRVDVVGVLLRPPGPSLVRHVVGVTR